MPTVSSCEPARRELFADARFSTACSLLVACLFAFSGAVAGTADPLHPQSSKTYALIMGVRHLDGGDEQGLFAEDQAKSVYDLLTDPKVGLATKETSSLLLQPTGNEVRRKLSEYRNKLRPNDTLIVFWAGRTTTRARSVFDSAEVEVMLVPIDGISTPDRFSNGIDEEANVTLSELAQSMMKPDANLIIIIDSPSPGPAFSSNLPNYPRVGVLATTRSLDTAGGSTLFSTALHRALREPTTDSDGNGLISVQEAFTVIYKEVTLGSVWSGTASMAGPVAHQLWLGRAPTRIATANLEFFESLPEDILNAGSVTINETEYGIDVKATTKDKLVLLGDSRGLVDRGIVFIETLTGQYVYWREDQKLQRFEEPYRNSFAVIVAIDDYGRRRDPQHRKPTRYEARTFMVQRGQELKRALMQVGFPEKNIIELYDHRATSSAIDKELKSFWKGGFRESADRVFFYFGGHGDTFDSSGVLITYDFDEVLPTQTGFLMRDLTTRHSENIVAHHVLFTLDACAAGLAVYHKLGNNKPSSDFGRLSIIRNDTAQKARNFLIAGTADQKAVWDEGGIFTLALIRGLKGGADMNSDRLIQFGELYTYVSNEVANKAAQKGVRQQVEDYVLDTIGPGKIIFLNRGAPKRP